MPELLHTLIAMLFAADVWAVYGIGLAARETAGCVVSILDV